MQRIEKKTEEKQTKSFRQLKKVSYGNINSLNGKRKVSDK